jgi:hypothetical protein
MHLQGSNCSNSSMGFGAVSITIHCLALYAIMFMKLCFNFMSIFLAYSSIMWSVTVSLSHN